MICTTLAILTLAALLTVAAGAKAQSTPAQDATLVKAFAFGANDFTREVANAPEQQYVKVVQDGANFIYDIIQGHGYTDSDDIDDTPNNRNVLSGPDEIYDQFIGAKGRGNEIIFRVDVPNGDYRFVAAGGDAGFGGHATTLTIRDGADGDTLVLVEQQRLEANTFYVVGFKDHTPPPAEGLQVQPRFLPLVESPALTVSQGYLEVIQTAAADRGGDLCVLELWSLASENQPPQIVHPVPNLVLNVTDDALEIDLNTVFSDPDGDALSFSMSNSGVEVVAAELAGASLVVTPLAEGTAAITLRADDNVNAEVAHTFAVAVQSDAPTLLEAEFDRDPEGFEFFPDTFRGTNQPGYATGEWIADGGFDGGAVQVVLGGVDDEDILGMSGGWRTDFTLGAPATVSISFQYKLTLAPKYELDEYSEVLVTVDDLQPGVGEQDYVARIAGDGNTGGEQSTGWQLFVANLGGLAGGSHTLTIGGYNNKKTSIEESTEILLDEVRIATERLNGPPFVVEAIPDASLTFDEELEIDLSSVFADPDGDALSFDVSNSNRQVVRAQLDDNILTLTPLAVGRSQITVSASDGTHPEVTETFQVTVEQANQPPSQVASLPDTTLSLPEGKFETDLADIFLDPDGDALSFSVSNSNGEVVLAQVAGSVLTLTPLAVGTANVTVHARDDFNPEVSDTFLVIVERANRAPEVTHLIPDTTLVLSGPVFEVDLHDFFFDPDGDEMQFSAGSSNEDVVQAAVDGSKLSLIAISVGSSDITVRARDATHPEISDTFRVTVTRANRAPEVTHPIPDTTLVLSGPVFEVDLHDFFFDPDGDEMQFSATSSNEEVVQASVDGSKLSLMTISEGSSDVIVRARDASHPEVSDTFRVTVKLANRAPEVTHPIPDTTLSLGGPGAEFDLAAVFQDPEADELVFGATSADTNIVAIALSGVILQIMPQAQGRSTITVTASDKINPEVALTFTITVTRNQAPAVRNPISHTTLALDGPDFITDLQNVFSDPEQDDLTFTASSSNASIAFAQVTGSILTVSPVSPGDITVHLTASDNVNPAVDYVFAVTVERLNRPPILAQPIADAMIFIGGHNFQLDLDTVFIDPDEESLSYNAVSTDEAVAFATVSHPLLTVIPLSEGSAVVKVWARDPNGGTDSTAFSVEVAQYPSIFQVSTSVSYVRREGAKAFDSQEYRMWGLPGADNRLIDALFSGQQDDAWQVFWDNGKPRNYFVAFDGSNNFRLATGRAFWVINNGPWHINLETPSAPLNAANEVEIPLHPGFNLIANPFDTTIDWLQVQSVNGVSEPIWSFDGVFNQATELVPNTGYYFFNREDLAVLRIPYRLTLASAGSEAAGASTVWRGKIALSSGKTQGESIVFGVARDARSGLDRLDHFKPRTISTGTSLYFDRADWHSDYSQFASDIRPEILEVESWPFRLQVAKGVRGTLTFSGLQQVAPEYDVYLVEMENGRSENLRVTSSYGFTAHADISTFKVIVGKREHVQDVLGAIVPTRFIVENNYPNPFNPTTTIPVSVPQRVDLTLQVYNLLGQKVRTLYAGVIEPGRYLFTWDGRDQSGKRVASGVYIYRVRFTSGRMFQGKMLMVK